MEEIVKLLQERKQKDGEATIFLHLEDENVCAFVAGGKKELSNLIATVMDKDKEFSNIVNAAAVAKAIAEITSHSQD